MQPAAAKPDAAEVSGLTTNLSTLEVQQVVDENASALADYGLDKPRVEVTFKTGGQQHTLQIGQKTPPGTDLYAKRAGDNTVFLISSYLDSTFNRGTFDLRDKTVLNVERDKVEAVDVTAGTQSMRFTRAGGEWQMTAPAPGRADFGAVEGLVGRIAGLQMKAIEQNATKLAQYGLEKPAATVTLGSGSSQATLLIGKEAGEGALYAKDASRPAVFTIESSILDDLKKDPAEYRQKDLFDARAFNSNRLEIARGSQTLVFEKVTTKNKDGQDEQKWRQTGPQARDVDATKMDALLNAITGARATGFATAGTKTGLDKPELTAGIKFDDGRKQDRVTFARSGADAYAQRAGDTSAAKIDTATLDAIVKALDALTQG